MAHIERVEMELPVEIVRTLQCVQAGLHAAGFRYIAGDVESWPLSSVVMMQGDAVILLAAWEPRQVNRLRDQWQAVCAQFADAALLLVGVAPVAELAEYDMLFGNQCVYVNALTREIHQASPLAAQRLPAILRETPLRGMLERVGQTLDTRQQRELLRQDLTPLTLTGIPYFTYAIIGICVLVFVAGLFDGHTDSTPGWLNLWGVLYGPFVRDGQWWRLLSHGFLHAGIIHLLSNMVALYVFGTELERAQGWWRVACLLFFAVLTGALVSLWWLPATPSVGISGGLFGLMGAYGALLARYWKDFPTAMRSGLRNWLWQLLGINVVFSMLPQVNYAAHLGGLVGGFLLGFLIMQSPRSGARQPAWAHLLLVCLLAVTVIAGWVIIGRIPG